MRDIPIIRLEVEGMKLGIMRAMSEHSAAMDAMVQKAVAAYCTPENLERIITDAAAREINAAIASEINRFYTLGDGRKVIREAVEQKLRTSTDV